MNRKHNKTMLEKVSLHLQNTIIEIIKGGASVVREYLLTKKHKNCLTNNDLQLEKSIGFVADLSNKATAKALFLLGRIEKKLCYLETKFRMGRKLIVLAPHSDIDFLADYYSDYDDRYNFPRDIKLDETLAKELPLLCEVRALGWGLSEKLLHSIFGKDFEPEWKWIWEIY